MALVCTFKVLGRFIGIALVEVFDLAELLVEFFKLIAGRN
jgi:hypothetical protein